jgi:SagB-type dehydrogenase family enzyme
LGPGDDISTGVWRYQPQDHSLVSVSAGGDPRVNLGQACLSQEWASQAAMSIVLYSNLEKGTQERGPRDYRRDMISAGRAGQRLYLAATALGLGCCGIGAFYDQEIAQLALLPEDCQPLYVLSCGPVKNWP